MNVFITEITTDASVKDHKRQPTFVSSYITAKKVLNSVKISGHCRLIEIKKT